MAPFDLSGVVHLVRPAGLHAHDLEDLRACIAGAPAPALFNHTVQCLLRHPEAEDAPPDDFSHWVNGVVQDRETAERLAFAASGAYRSPGEMRAALLTVLDLVPEAERRARAAPEEGDLDLLTLESIPVTTGLGAEGGAALMEALAAADASVWFFHLYEEPWFGGPGRGLVAWLRERGEERLAALLEECVAEGLPLGALRRRALRRWRRTGLARRVAEAAGVPEDERREAAHSAVAGLVRRLTGGEERP